MSNDRPAPPDPFLMQLAVNHKPILARVAWYRAQEIVDVAAFCVLTRDKHTMAMLSRVTGQEVKPVDYDPQQHAGIMGAGKRAAVVQQLRDIYGSKFEAAKQLEQHTYNPVVLPVFIQIPTGRWVLHLWAGVAP